jgi:hypothetical protein
VTDIAEKRFEKLERLKKQAAEDIRLPVDHRRVLMLAALRLNHETLLEKMIAGGNVDPTDLMTLTETIEKLHPPLPPAEIKVTIVEGVARPVKCPHCGRLSLRHAVQGRAECASPDACRSRNRSRSEGRRYTSTSTGAIKARQAR